MYTKRRLTLNLDVYTFVDEDYDEDDRSIGVDVVDSLELTSIVTELPDKLVRQLGNYITQSSSGQHIWTKEIPDFMIGNPASKVEPSNG